MAEIAKPKRLLFFRPAQANVCPTPAISYQIGVPVSSGSTLRDHVAAFDLVGNSGNMIHRMAMVQMLRFDRQNSSQVNLFRLMKKLGSIDRVAQIINDKFDGIVITMSNFLRRKASEPGMAELLTKLDCSIYCVGAGLQDELPLGDISVLEPDLADLMRVLNQKAVLFGVRGHKTLEWLHSVGIDRATAIGCPSMFVYPRNIMSLRPPKQIENIISAGHMVLSKKPDSRSHKLMRALNGVRTAYVFQGEHKNFLEILDTPNVYNEATQTLNADVINEYISNKCAIEPPFSEYYSFNEVSAWRQACLRFDAYAGDRIHGGVAAMQAGVPALILYDDARVAELASYHSLPSCTLDEFSMLGCRAALRKYLNDETLAKMKEDYALIAQRFYRTLHDAGLQLQNDERSLFEVADSSRVI
ncbi:hypothetical protein FHS21_006212 [Phyllobacterium trifolii]|uniref:Polysaccharide pyruvyl transferase domain-containing protein n=1 Tax=Phyllobacterium trifolii TaxID=300193 RepID=A0A839UF42_9HYPH|nr:polysaccharide pyruvyl transferase family protein [Phyllobacterium trifolii]MBB3149758.1 hypothetical protein [Phyllobacterium trifolii]